MGVKRRVLLVTVFVTLTGSATAGDFEEFKSACVSALSDQILDPERLRIDGATDMVSRRASLDDAMGWGPIGASRESDLAMAGRNTAYFDLLRARFLAVSDASFVHFTIIDYRAPNGFGAMVHGRTTCSLVTQGDSLPDAIDQAALLLNGRTGAQWGMVNEMISYGQDGPLPTSDMLKVLKRVKAPR